MYELSFKVFFLVSINCIYVSNGTSTYYVKKNIYICICIYMCVCVCVCVRVHVYVVCDDTNLYYDIGITRRR